jgi:hypothetical protein
MTQFFSVFDGVMSSANSLGSGDFWIIAGILILFFFFGLYIGKSHLMALIIAWYPAAFIYGILPLSVVQKFANGSGTTLFIINLVVFLIIFSISYNTISRSLGFGNGFGGFFQAIQVILLAAGFADLLLILVCRIIPVSAFYNFSPTVINFFANQNYYPWLLLSPIILAFLTSW